MAIWRKFREVVMALHQAQYEVKNLETEQVISDDTELDAEKRNKAFRDLYVGAFTDAHAEELNALRQVRRTSPSPSPSLSSSKHL